MTLPCLQADPSISDACAADLRAARERDVACDTYTKCLLFFKGFHVSFIGLEVLVVKGRHLK